MNEPVYWLSRRLVHSSFEELSLKWLQGGVEAALGFSKESLELSEGVNMADGWCMKCKVQREMKDSEAVTMKNGRPATKGVCTECGTKMFKIDKTS